MVKKNRKMAGKAKASSPQKPRPPKKAKAAGRPASIPWLASLRDPFNTAPVCIPDQETGPTMKATSRYVGEIQSKDYVAGGSATGHGFVTAILPFPNGDTIAATGFFDSGVGYFGNSVLQIQSVPNFAALFPPGTNNTTSGYICYRVRPTAMAARLTYKGTELNRAGEVACGLIPIEALNTSSTSIDAFGQAFGANTGANFNAAHLTASDFDQRCLREMVTRNQDGTYQVTWRPNGAPSYTKLFGSTAQPDNLVSTMGNAIAFMVTGDTTGSVSATGNVWSLEVIWHWEIQPSSTIVTAIPVTPSYCNLAHLQVCLNQMQRDPALMISRGFRSGATAGDGSYGGTASYLGTLSQYASDYGPSIAKAAYRALMAPGFGASSGTGGFAPSLGWY